MTPEQSKAGRGKYDISIIRPEIRAEQVALRGRDFPRRRRRAIHQGLLALHTLELMAVNIYKFQITHEPSELNRQLIAAMCNEMTHLQDFQTRLYEFGLKPRKTRWAFWLVGFVFGFTSRLLGRRAILKTGIWVETKAVHHYAQLLESIDWDDDTRNIIEKNQADEDGHIARWTSLLNQSSG